MASVSAISCVVKIISDVRDVTRPGSGAGVDRSIRRSVPAFGERRWNANNFDRKVRYQRGVIDAILDAQSRSGPTGRSICSKCRQLRHAEIGARRLQPISDECHWFVLITQTFFWR